MVYAIKKLDDCNIKIKDNLANSETYWCFDSWLNDEENLYKSYVDNSDQLTKLNKPKLIYFKHNIKFNSIKRIKPKNLFTTQSTILDKDMYDSFISLEGEVIFKELHDKSKFSVTIKFTNKIVIVFNDSELYKRKKKFHEVKLGDKTSFIFFFKTGIFTKDNLLKGDNKFDLTTFRQFFIIPNNVYYKNHLFNITKNNSIFNVEKSFYLKTFFNQSNYYIIQNNNIIDTSLKNDKHSLLLLKNDFYRYFLIILNKMRLIFYLRLLKFTTYYDDKNNKGIVIDSSNQQILPKFQFNNCYKHIKK